MKGLKLSLIILTATMLTIGLSGMAYAFHDGGVAYCEGCHTMHNSLGGNKMYRIDSPGSVPTGSVGTANAYLLQGSDQSSTCLMCHAREPGSSYHIFDTTAGTGIPPRNYTPGGDFGWLKKTFTWGTSSSSPGETHGHNVVAIDFGLAADSRFSGKAPGASGSGYPTASLGCQSCHDPHGRYRITDDSGTVVLPTLTLAVLPIAASGSTGTLPTTTTAVGVYRLLGGKGYYPKSVSATYAFSADTDPPAAVTPSPYNRTEGDIPGPLPGDPTTPGKQTRVAYGTGMSEWCANCHGLFHGQASGGTPGSFTKHPSGNLAKLSAEVVNNYNAYVKTGDLRGTPTNSYLSLVPFEEGTSRISSLKPHAKNDDTYLDGPTTSNNIMCLTCHRAHASAWDSAGRWNFRATFLTKAGAYPTGNDAQGRTDAEWQAGMYGRAATIFATYQRSLCNKCHVKD